MLVYVVCMNEDEDVVYTDGQNEERNDFNDDESRWNTQVTEETDAWCHGEQNDQHSARPERQLGINLKCQQLKS